MENETTQNEIDENEIKLVPQSEVSEAVVIAIQTQKINLKEDDVLVVQLKGDAFAEMFQNELVNLSEGLKGVFPDNKVVVLVVPQNNEINLTIVGKEEYPECKNTGGSNGTGGDHVCNNCTSCKCESGGCTSDRGGFEINSGDCQCGCGHSCKCEEIENVEKGE